jgi:sulfate-transporting ATPase
MTDNDSAASGEEVTRDQVARALNRLSPKQVEEISPKFVREHYSRGQTIIRQGDPADRFYIITSGQAEIFHEDLSGNITVLEPRLPGDYFGEIGLFKNQPRTATVRAPLDGEVEVLALDHGDFQGLLKDSKATEAHVAQEMIRRLIQLADAQ